MCAVSNIGDQYGQRYQPFIQTVGGGAGQPLQQPQFIWPNTPSREEFEALRKDVAEMKELLLKAKEEDKKAGISDCEMEDKIKVLKAVAEAVGINLDEVFKK